MTTRKLGYQSGWSVLLATLLIFASTMSQAAYTEPRLALLRVTPYRSTTGTITLKIEGSLSFADAVQLALPLSVSITQGSLSARFDLAGNVFTSTAGGAEQAAAGPGVIAIAPRAITLVLPPGFTTGAASAQVTANYDGKLISSNRLSCDL
jgi:hypothetical protein